MTTSTHHQFFDSNESSIASPSLTKNYANLVIALSSSDKDEATSIPQKLENRANLEKSLCLVDVDDDNDDLFLVDGHNFNDDDEDNNNDVDGNSDDEHGDGSNDWGGGDVTVECEGSKLEDSNGLVRCSSTASITSNYIHGMEESSGSALGNEMDSMVIEKVWTNEKHNTYLDLMEKNFIRDMYAQDYFSLELYGNQPHSQLECESEASMVYTGTSSDIMDELEEEEEESESELNVGYSSTIMDELMSSEDARQCMETSISSSSSFLRRKGAIFYINNAKKRKRTTFPSFANSGPSNC